MCKLLKILYDLKQSFYFWYKRFSMFFLKKLGLKRIYINYSIFLLATDLKNLIFNIFIDNIKIIILKDSRIISKIKKKHTTTFFILDIGPISF